MARTTVAAVQDLLGRDYTPSRGIKVFIETATAIVDDIVQYASDNDLPAVPAAKLELIERWVACDAYTASDRIYKSNSTLRVSASYATRKNDRPYMATAADLDPTGYLSTLLNDDGNASAFWAGKPPSEQTDYIDRD